MVDVAPPAAESEITVLLRRWSAGDAAARDQLIPLVYDRLRALAHRQLGAAPAEQSLDTCALVHEAYLKLTDAPPLDFPDRAHFLALASRVMRNLLADRARSRAATKRGSGRSALELDEELLVSDEDTTLSGQRNTWSRRPSHEEIAPTPQPSRAGWRSTEDSRSAPGVRPPSRWHRMSHHCRWATASNPGPSPLARASSTSSSGAPRRATRCPGSLRWTQRCMLRRQTSGARTRRWLIELFAGSEYGLWNGRLALARESSARLLADARTAGDTALARCARHAALLLETQLATPTMRQEAARLALAADSVLRRFDPGSEFLDAAGSLIMARVWERLGDLPRAVAATKRVAPTLILWPFYSTYLGERARLSGLAGDREGAIEAYSAYVKLRAPAEPSQLPDLVAAQRELDVLTRSSRARRR